MGGVFYFPTGVRLLGMALLFMWLCEGEFTVGISIDANESYTHALHWPGDRGGEIIIEFVVV